MSVTPVTSIFYHPTPTAIGVADPSRAPYSLLISQRSLNEGCTHDRLQYREAMRLVFFSLQHSSLFMGVGLFKRT